MLRQLIVDLGPNLNIFYSLWFIYRNLLPSYYTKTHTTGSNTGKHHISIEYSDVAVWFISHICRPTGWFYGCLVACNTCPTEMNLWGLPMMLANPTETITTESFRTLDSDKLLGKVYFRSCNETINTRQYDHKKPSKRRLDNDGNYWPVYWRRNSQGQKNIFIKSEEGWCHLQRHESRKQMSLYSTHPHFSVLFLCYTGLI